MIGLLVGLVGEAVEGTAVGVFDGETDGGLVGKEVKTNVGTDDTG